MPSSNRAHVRRHIRFYGAALLGGMTWRVREGLHVPMRLPVACIAFFGTYLVSTAVMLRRISPAHIGRRAARKDESIVVIVVLTLLAVGLSTIVALPNQPERPDARHLVVALLAVPLGWTTLHTALAWSAMPEPPAGAAPLDAPGVLAVAGAHAGFVLLHGAAIAAVHWLEEYGSLADGLSKGLMGLG